MNSCCFIIRFILVTTVTKTTQKEPLKEGICFAIFNMVQDGAVREWRRKKNNLRR